MTGTSATRTLDVTPLHRDLYTAVAVGGLSDGRRRGEEAINTRWYQTATTINQMLDLAHALADPYLVARVEQLKDDKRQFFTRALRAFRSRFDSAREMVEDDRIEFVSSRVDEPLGDHTSLSEYVPNLTRRMYAVSYDEGGAVRSQYSVGFVNGTPIIPTGDTVNRPHVILEKYALSHALITGQAYTNADVQTPLLV